ncbi:MAG: 16S rRNA (cytosine(1402)-N(4))-methyltransferase RsmH [Gemmatimonadaceae bacterium]|nr:16S rRNA (cytosine(1402)-N(4))-methyltransferase RsmH [Gemmatimonadaceae bacterium]NUO94041.1 16S rRNA (cytosine(1402)-N(4))-methyltransferase RsmH [Gemmatimonadaceae bacterium]NUP72573.1 16S rRNA (cytosine(1402)-N(4))-methyltransferase RsmH [Gemmatimonadaceae bacterium]NUS34704.1 16S rRNA (cytosine(1402)-N(4))-methyltransferase RsmH [Gemmatimonadaceae bacterium]NUS48813.1 16S rRNA (cytosine(1402)-N(4))-methyltransferase RsmH [Gemmatimonadaceae bacterium]
MRGRTADVSHQTEATWDSTYHAPALVGPVVELLGGSELVLDGTLGGGGHTAALLDAGVGRVIGVDRDPDALAAATARLSEAASAGRFSALHGNYAAVDELPLDDLHFTGILLDLGISSHQIDDATRGFSFRDGAPLDMRMGQDTSRSAADLLNEADEGELMTIFREYGDEPHAGRLAREIVRRRANRPFAISDDFVGAIRGALGPRTGASDFARLFQAVRIAVNDELAGLERALPALRDRLAPGGVLAIIAYHSGEDRLVKHAFRRWSEDCVCPPRLPVCACGGGHALGTVLTRRAVVASPDEVARNPRARSARLRAWRRAE